MHYYHIFACQVFQRELSYLIAESENVISVTWLPQGLHETPAILKKRLEQAMKSFLEDVDSGRIKHMPEAFLFAYGMCSNGTVGLKAERAPLVLPKTDDCIGIFLGSQQRYLRLFNEKSGAYWLNSGWVETSFVPTEDQRRQRKEQYVKKYGDDNANYLMEQESLFIKNYSRCGYINSDACENDRYRSVAKSLAKEWSLEFFEEQGDASLLKKLVNGNWDEEHFLVCPKGYQTAASYDKNLICSKLIK